MELFGICMMFMAIGMPIVVIGVIVELFTCESKFVVGCICVGATFILMAFMAFFLCMLQEGIEIYRGY